MNPFIESLKRLYRTGKVSTEKLRQMVVEQKISEEEYIYITT